MDDIWHRDTREALDKFNDTFCDVKDQLVEDHSLRFDTLYSEVDGLLDQYEEKVNTIEELEDKVRELEYDLQAAEESGRGDHR